MSQGDHQFLWVLLSDRFLIDIRTLKPRGKIKMNELKGAGEEITEANNTNNRAQKTNKKSELVSHLGQNLAARHRRGAQD